MPKAAPQSTTRRALLSAAPAITALAIPAVALAGAPSAADPAISAKEERWREIEAFARASDPHSEIAMQLPLAVLRARLKGLDPDDFSGLYITRGREKRTLSLHFGSLERKNLVVVTADRAWRWEAA